jgi:hypothetical protein
VKSLSCTGRAEKEPKKLGKKGRKERKLVNNKRKGRGEVKLNFSIRCVYPQRRCKGMHN